MWNLELPFEAQEKFGVDETEGILRYLEEERIIRHSGEKWFWSSAAYPAEEVSLRSASSENFIIINTSENNTVLGEVDLHSAPMLIHEQAIYLHQSKQYIIDKLDWDGRTAYAREVVVDYYTDSVDESDIKVISTDLGERIETAHTDHPACAHRHFGEVAVSTIVPKYKKIRFETHENVGFGYIICPALDKQTESYWVSFCRTDGGIYRYRKRAIHALSTLYTTWYGFCAVRPQDIRSVPMVRAFATDYLFIRYLSRRHGIARKIYDIDTRLLKQRRINYEMPLYIRMSILRWTRSRSGKTW